MAVAGPVLQDSEPVLETGQRRPFASEWREDLKTGSERHHR